MRVLDAAGEPIKSLQSRARNGTTYQFRVDTNAPEGATFICATDVLQRPGRGAALVEVLCAAAGEVVIREGESGNEAFVIVSGRCAVTATSHGKRVVLRELGPGDVFGETAVFAAEPRTATVEATEALEVRVVTGETLSQALGLQTWTGAFIKALAGRFLEADRRARDL